MKKIILFVVFCSLIFWGCNILQDSDCSGEMDDTRQKEGDPEEMSRYDAEDYHSVEWWYWTKGIEYTFEWGEIVDGCEISTYTFTPIEPIKKHLIEKKHCCKKATAEKL